MHAAAAADTVVLARSSTVPVVPVILYRYMYTSSGARATFRHHARAEEALQYSSLIATEELTELLKPVVLCPSNIYSAVVRREGRREDGTLLRQYLWIATVVLSMSKLSTVLGSCYSNTVLLQYR